VANGHVFVDQRWVFPALDAQREGSPGEEETNNLGGAAET